MAHNKIIKKKKYGKIIDYQIDYSNHYNYEYLIKEYIANLLPVKFEKDDWENAKFKHYSEKCNIKKSESDKKFDIDIVCKEYEDGKYNMIFTSKENQLIIPMSKVNYKVKIYGVVKVIHNIMVNIPLAHSNNIFSKQYVDSIYKSAIQTGICIWLQNNFVGLKNNVENDNEIKNKLDERGILFYNILDKYEEWSSKTYEGHPVSFGVMIDRNNMNLDVDDDKINYLDMLNLNDFAPISEIPFSIVQIDSNGYIKNYLSNCSNNEKVIYESYYHPIEIRDFINICNSCKSQEGQSDYIGILLLKNSEIAIVKNNKLECIKKDGRWYNYSYIYFKDCLVNSGMNLNNSQIQQLYFNVLNLSFAKTGGCISIVSKEALTKFTSDFNKNNWFDNLIIKKNKSAKKYNKGNEEQKKFYNYKLNKKHIIEKLINNENFYEIDPRLILELSSMDGATIIDEEGNIIAVSSIVDLTERGEGGGRSAATKTLSKYGIAIKVSTDGYFEVYKNTNIIYTLK